jgi:protein-tyrosine phosphatase
MTRDRIRVLFVCLGNVCRSPLAQGIMCSIVSHRGIMDKFTIDSAGTSAYHVGSSPDKRSVDVANANGINLIHRARQFTQDDFTHFDFILAMDHLNHEDILTLSVNKKRDSDKVFLLRSFDQVDQGDFTIPDPYYGVNADFQQIFELCERSIAGFLGFLADKKYLTLV